jgi:hypothetical protein
MHRRNYKTNVKLRQRYLDSSRSDRTIHWVRSLELQGKFFAVAATWHSRSRARGLRGLAQ